MLRTVRFFEGSTKWPYGRQTPGNDRIFGGTRFLFGPGDEPADWLVVLNFIPKGTELKIPRERAILLCGEPPSIRKYRPDYLGQFGTVISVDREIEHPGAQFGAPFLPWHVGIASRDPSRYPQALSFAQLAQAPEKTRLCSCICSNLARTRGHRRRLAFVKRLRRAFSDKIDFFGRGGVEVADKEEALAPYRFHIAIENSMIPDYWTEKLGDAFLRNAYPIYAGAPNITDYFDPGSLAVIDISKPDDAIRRIGEILDSEVDRRAAPAIAEAKRKVMWEYNLLARIDRLLDTLDAETAPIGEPQVVRPERSFGPEPAPWYIRFHERVQATSRRLRRRSKAR